MLEETATRHRVRILLVEDDADDRLFVRVMLRDAGDDALLTTCTRLDEAIESLSGGGDDIVLLDLALPDSDGLSGLRRLRAAAPEVPVVVLSGRRDDRVALEALALGAQDYLIKGAMDGATLSRAIRFALERQRAERRLARMALRDPLTGLPNRVLFMDRLQQALARRGAHRLALMFVDLNEFKAVNDRYGHLSGDDLLVEVGVRLRAELRAADTVARLGGDEFTILVEGVSGAAEAMALGRRIAVSLGRPYDLTGGVASISAAVGVTLGAAGEEPDELLRRADEAMYEAKAAGPGISILSG